MSIYRRKLPGGNKRSRWFTAEFRYRGHTHRKGGFADREQARDWLNTEMLRRRRGSTGYVKPMLRAQVTPLIRRYAEHLSAKGRDELYVYIAGKRLNRLASECGWVVLDHVTSASLDAWKDGDVRTHRRPIVDRTKNQYLATAREWGNWLVKPAGVLPINPLADVAMLPARHNDEYRRAGTMGELNALLAACDARRRLYYLCRLYTPMRGGTYGRLNWQMAHLDATPPFFKTPAEINKSRREEKHVIRYELAQELRATRKRAKADDLIFPDAPTLADFRADLQAAGVAFDDGKGNRRLDYHALRRTLVRIAKRAGVSRDDASLLLGHRDPRTTAKYYDEDAVDPDLGASVERLPSLGGMRRAE